jgi:hypothetical protein
MSEQHLYPSTEIGLYDKKPTESGRMQKGTLTSINASGDNHGDLFNAAGEKYVRECKYVKEEFGGRRKKSKARRSWKKSQSRRSRKNRRSRRR